MAMQWRNVKKINNGVAQSSVVVANGNINGQQYTILANV